MLFNGKEQLDDNPNIHAGHRVIYPRSFTDYNNHQLRKQVG